ncbi:MAG: hypothetical protein ACK56I_18545, partial [bacterium]
DQRGCGPDDRKRPVAGVSGPRVGVGSLTAAAPSGGHGGVGGRLAQDLRLERERWGFQRMDLPASLVSAAGQQGIQLVGRLLGAGVRTDVTGLETVPDGQQIHT